MKFGKKLRQRLQQEWAHEYINYKSLKQLLKRVFADINFTKEDCRDAFIKQIELEFSKVNAFFSKQVSDLEKVVFAVLNQCRHDALALPTVEPAIVSMWNVLGESLRPGDHDSEEEENEEKPATVALEDISSVERKLDSLRSYVTLNYLGFEKIFRKFYKRTGMQLDMSLASVAAQPFYFSVRLGKLLTLVQCAWVLLSATVHSPATREAFECSICLEGLCQPVILSCAHWFCAKCYETYDAHRSGSKHLDCPVCRRLQSPAETRLADATFSKFLQLLPGFKPSEAAYEEARSSVEESGSVSDSGKAKAESEANKSVGGVAGISDGDQLEPKKHKTTTAVPLSEDQLQQLGDFAELLQHAAGTYVVLDIDETIITNQYNPCLLLSRDGLGAFNNCLKTSKGQMSYVDRMAIRDLYHEGLGQTRLCQQNTAEVIRTLQTRGCVVFGLTARQAEHAEQTRNDLLRVGVDLRLTAPFPSAFKKGHSISDDVTGAVYVDGVLYSGRERKGVVLRRFLELLVARGPGAGGTGSGPAGSGARAYDVPRALVFVDDQAPNLLSVARWVSGDGACERKETDPPLPTNPRLAAMPLYCYHYTKATYLHTQRVHNVSYYNQNPDGSPCFGQQILKLQLQKLFFEKKIVGDEEAILAIKGQ